MRGRTLGKMEYTLIWRSICLLTCLGVCHAGKFEINPKNQVVLTGSRVIFRCRPPNNATHFSWRQTANGVDVPMTLDGTVYSDYQNKITLDMDSATKDYNLVIGRTVKDDAKSYNCYVPYPLNSSYAELIVLDKPPTCRVNVNLTDLMENEGFVVSCEASFKGKWDPLLVCRDIVGEGPNITIQDMGSSPGATLHAGFTVDRASTGLNGHRYSCRMSFPSPPLGVLPPNTNTAVYNMDAPSYSFTYQTETLNIQFPARSLQIPNLKSVYNPFDRVSCTAEGRPAIRVRWVNVNTSQTEVSGRDLVVTAAMEGRREYRCEVENTIRNIVYTINKTIAFLVIIPTTTTTTTTTTTPIPTTTVYTPGPGEVLQSGLSGGHIAGIVIGVLLALIILFIVLYVLLCRRAPSKGIAKEKLKPRMDGVDTVRRQIPPAVAAKPQHPYDAAKPTNNDFAKPSTPTAALNQWGELSPPMYDVALDDTPRSRKPVQVYDSPDYTDFRRV